MPVAAAVRQIRPMRRHTGRSTSLENAVNTGFHGTSRPVLHRSIRIKEIEETVDKINKLRASIDEIVRELEDEE